MDYINEKEIYNKQFNLIAQKYGFECIKDEVYEERTDKSTKSRFIIKVDLGDIIVEIINSMYYDEYDKAIECYNIFLDRPISSKYDTGKNLEDIQILTELYNYITGNKIKASDVINFIKEDKTHWTIDEENLFGTLFSTNDKKYSFIYGGVKSLNFWGYADVLYAGCFR